MGKYSERLLGAGFERPTVPIVPTVPTERIEPAIEEEPGMFEMFTGAARETPETRELPEFRETPEFRTTEETGSLAKTLKMTAGMMFTIGDKESQDIIKKNIPGATFTKDAKGNVIVDIDGKRSILNKPGWSGQDSIRALTQVLSFATPAKLAGMTKGLLTKIGVGAIGAGATEAGIQEMEKLAGSEEERSVGRIVSAAALGGVGEAVGPAIRGIKRARQAKRLQVGKEELMDVAGSIAEAESASAKAGIGLAYPQKTAVPAQLEEMSFITQLPAGTKESMRFLRKQNVQAADAVEAYMNTLAPAEAITKGAERFRTASQLAVGAKKRIRKEAASPIYKRAFQDKTGIDTKEISDLITDKMADFPESGEVSKTLNKIQSLISPIKKGKELIQPNIKKLHNAKLEIDQMISGFGEKSLGNTTKREVMEIKDSLLSFMDKASPDYKIAREEFSKLSPEVTKIQESIIGKMADIPDTQLKTISRRIFDPAETNVQTIRNAKKTISSIDPGAWNDLMRVEIERRLGSVAGDITEAGIGVVENIPGQLHRALFKPTKQRNILYSALDGEQKENLKFLETALKRASLGRVTGSQTAIREDIKRRLQGGVVQSIRNFFKSPVDTLVSTGEDAAFNQRVRGLAKALFSPEYKMPIGKIRRMNPKSSAALKAMTQLLNDIQQQEEK